MIYVYTVFGNGACTCIVECYYYIMKDHLVLGMNTCLLKCGHRVQATGGHAWYVHKGHAEGNGTCSDHLGAQYNPYRVNTTAESGYLDDCSSLRQQRCAMGDLGGKLGTLGLEPMTNSHHKTYSFYDENLHVLGPFSSESLDKPAVLFMSTIICKCPWLNPLHASVKHTL